MIVEALKGHTERVPLVSDITIWRATARVVAQKRLHRCLIEKKMTELVARDPRMNGTSSLVRGERITSEGGIEYIDLGQLQLVESGYAVHGASPFKTMPAIRKNRSIATSRSGRRGRSFPGQEVCP